MLCLRLLRLWRSFSYHLRTAVLFTLADLKTIFIPICVFACAAAPLHSTPRLLCTSLWIWLHQLMCNVSNQARGCLEDAVNKPWRPLPSGRLTEPQARALRWITVAACIVSSIVFDAEVILATVALVLTTFFYDELGLAGHYIGKNLCNIGGYTSFEIGATKLMGKTRDLDDVSMAAVCISGILIFTTIQAQDFADVEGDKQLGRITFPIYAPQTARRLTLLALIGWSLFLVWFWDIGLWCRMMFVVLGITVGVRFYVWRDPSSDRRSYELYNVWLTAAHLFPFHARTGCLAF